MAPVFMSLFTHLTWADGKVLQALRDHPAPLAPALALFGHVLAAEHVWLARIEGRAPAVPVWPALGIDECGDLAGANAAGYQALLERSGPGELARTVHYTNSAGLTFDNQVQDILLHVCLHGQYHRGQVARLLRETGAVPPSTDYIAWARGVPAATRQT